MKADALTIEDITKLIGRYEECIEHAFDAFQKYRMHQWH